MEGERLMGPLSPWIEPFLKSLSPDTFQLWVPVLFSVYTRQCWVLCHLSPRVLTGHRFPSAVQSHAATEVGAHQKSPRTHPRSQADSALRPAEGLKGHLQISTLLLINWKPWDSHSASLRGPGFLAWGTGVRPTGFTQLRRVWSSDVGERAL